LLYADGSRTGRRPESYSRPKGTNITLTITPEALATIDELAATMGQSRAALINLAIFEWAAR
jgi:hypothetical protein